MWQCPIFMRDAEDISEMNKKQIIAMWAGITIIVLMGLFPPHMIGYHGMNLFLGYDFIMHPRTWLADDRHVMVDFTRLLTQWIIVLALMAGIIITFKDKNT